VSDVDCSFAHPLPKEQWQAAGIWNVAFASDYGGYEGVMNLHCDGKTISGTWDGALGKDLAVTGTWRDGYVELTFTGGWKDDSKSTPIPAVATLAGWIDDDSAAGRMKVESRADGLWSAVRRPCGGE
jgi:hypothetical protein